MRDTGGTKCFVELFSLWNVLHHPSCFTELLRVGSSTFEVANEENITLRKRGIFYRSIGRITLIMFRAYYIHRLMLIMLSCARWDDSGVMITFQNERCNPIGRCKNERVNGSQSRRSSNRLQIAKVISPPRPRKGMNKKHPVETKEYLKRGSASEIWFAIYRPSTWLMQVYQLHIIWFIQNDMTGIHVIKMKMQTVRLAYFSCTLRLYQI